MNVAKLIEQVHAAGGRIEAKGETLKLAAPKPLPDDLMSELRQHKGELLSFLRAASHQVETMTANDEALIRTWLAYIEETDQDTIAEVLAKCRDNPEARAYFLHRAEEMPSPVALDRQVTCGACRHFQRIEHLHLGHCAQGELEAAAGLWDTDCRLCGNYTQAKVIH